MGSLDTSRIGLVSWSLKSETPSSLIQQLQSLRMKKVQLALWASVHRPEVWGDAPRQIEDGGISVASGMWDIAGGVIDDAQWAANVTETAAVARYAEGNGIRLLTSHIGHLPERGHEKYPLIVSRVMEAAKILDDHGCRFLFETGPERSDVLCALLDDVAQAGSPRVGINFDPGNMLIYNSDDPTNALRNFLPWIEQCHLKDARRALPGSKRGVEAPVGEGDVDWTAFFTILAEAGYAGDLIIEREGGSTIPRDVAAAVELTTRLINQINGTGRPS